MTMGKVSREKFSQPGRLLNVPRTGVLASRVLAKPAMCRCQLEYFFNGCQKKLTSQWDRE